MSSAQLINIRETMAAELLENGYTYIIGNKYVLYIYET